MANQVDFKILPSDQFNVYSPQTRSEKIITYFTLLSKLRGDILAVSSQDDPNNIVAAYYSNVGNTQTLHLVKADGSEVTASNSFAGTVTSIDMSVPTGFAISGNPITTSGTLNVSFASGYSLPTNALQATWTTAYNRSITSAAVTGTSTKTLTLNQQDGGTITASWSDIDTGLTSVGLSMPSAFAVANSPLTVNGTIAVTGAGTSAQYIRGDGQLANFPNSGGGGSTINYYLNGSVNQGTFGGTTYYEMSKTPIAGAGTNFTRTSAQGPGYIASFITDAGDPALLNVPGGNWNLEIYFNASSSGGGPSFYGELYKVSSSNVFTLIASNSANPEGITNGTTVDQYFTSIAVPQTTLLATDRLAVRIFVTPDGRDITLHTEDNNFCEVITTFSTGLNALNGLTAQVQYFATGTSGTDFNINSVTDTHTFNLPTASGTNRGALSSADWTTFNSKASDAFKTIAVAGQSNVVADSATDTLTFEAGSNIIITTDAATDKITITAVGGGSGSVTSVDMSVPTGFAISGNPIVTSGTLALAFASGYSLPTTASQANWNTAYNDSITAFSYNTSTGVLTLTQQDAGTLTATVTLQPFTTDNLTQGSTNLYDKVVSLTGAGTTVVTGTYPSFTITSNDQHVGTVTSVATTAPITGGTITSTGTIGITQSGTASDGYLSSTDWNTFNSKVGGSGTINYVSKWTSTGAIGNSQIFDSGTYVGINTASPAAKLDISGAHVASIGLLRLNASAANVAAQTYYIDGAYKAATYAGTDDNFYILGRDADIVFSTTSSATARMTISNGGNVGIGTNAPTQKLMVSGAIRVTGGYYDSSNSIGSNGQVLASTGTGTTWINASGGTVNGSGTVNYLSKWTGTTLLGDSVIYDNGTNVGIGTTAPGEKLQVNGLIRVTNPTFAGVEYHNTNGTWELYVGTESGGSGARYNSASSKHTFYNNSSAVLSIVSSGNVGIGNTLPSQKLHVEGNLRVTGAYYDSANGAGSSGQVLSSTGSGTSWVTPFSGSGTTNYVAKWTSGTALGNSSIFDNGTNVGVGTAAPNNKLSVIGNIEIQSGGSKIGFNVNDAFSAYSTSVAHYGISYGFSANPLALSGYFGVGVFTSGTERMRIDGSGFVGIGTTSPSRLLHVAGNAQVDGWIFQGGYYNGSVTLPYPGANYGNGRIYLRLCSSASGRIMTAKVRISSTWNWAPAFGSVEADISFHWDGSSLVYSYVNILSATGLAATNLTFGALAVEGGSISVPVYSINSNPIYAYIQLSPDADPSQVSYSTWSSVAFPGQSNVYVQTNLGVGTPSPAYRLDVNGVARFQDQVRFKNDVWQISDSDGFNRLYFSPSGRTYFGSGNGYEWRSSSDTALAVITNGGNLGINETAPSQRLHVSGNVRVTGAYYDSANAAGTSGQILSSTGTGTAWISPGGGGGIITGSGTTNYVTKWTSGTAVGDSSIYDNGSVGIGTTNPGHKLQVDGPSNNWAGLFNSGTAATYLSYGSGYGAYINAGTSASSSTYILELVSNGSTRMFVRGDGNVGIGTTTPQKPLEAISSANDFVSVGVNQIGVGNWTGIHFGYREANTNYRKSAIVFERTDLTANDAQGKIHILNGPQGGSGSATLADAKLTIAENGNVGIGSTSPSCKLTVDSSAGFSWGFPSTAAVKIGTPGTGGSLLVMTPSLNASYESGLAVDGTYSSGKTVVNINAFGVYSGGPYSADMVFKTSTNTTLSEKMRITNDGNVGIGTTAPLYKLQASSAASFGTTAYGVLNIAADNPAYIKIRTAIPFSYGSQGYTVNVKGFQYGSSETLDLQICWHQYADIFYNPTITSKGSFAPVVRLARESGLVVIVLTWGQYWPKLYVESVHNYVNDGYANGWSWVDENVTGDKTVTLSYKNNFGDGFVKTASGNVGIGNGSPSEKLHVSNGVAWFSQTASQGSAFRWGALGTAVSPDTMLCMNQLWNGSGWTILNSGVGTTYINLGSQVTSPDIQFGTGPINTAATTRMIIKNDGSVGINETAPSQRLHVSGNIRVTGAYYDSANGAGTSGQILSSTGTGTAWIAAPSGGITGSGTTNYVTKWTGTSAVGNSQIFDNGTSVGIGTTAPSDKLHVAGGILASFGSTNGYVSLQPGSATVQGYVEWWKPGLARVAYMGYNDGVSANNLGLTLESSANLIINGGNIGIGTTAPNNVLTINRDTSAGTVSSIPGISFKNRNNTNSIFVHSGIFADTYRDVADPHYSGGIWFTRNPEVSNLSSSSDIVFGTGINVGTGLLPSERMRITSAGNVGIGTTAPDAKLHVDGTVATNSALADVGAYRILKPNGGIGSYSSGQSGAIKITYPVGYTYSMHRVKVNVYEYTTNESFTIYFGGYNYAASSEWYNEFAYILSNSGTDRNFTVRFGYDGSKMVVYIGELYSYWQYPQIFIEEVEIGYSGHSATWRDGAWGIGFETSAFQNVTRTVANTQATNWGRNGSASYYNFGSVGIGTASPERLLHVNGGSGNVDNLVLESAYVSAGVGVAMQFNRSSGVLARIRGIEEGAWNGGLLFEVRSGSTYPGYNGATDVAMKIATNGNVGIGTTAPAQKLHVDGAIRLTSNPSVTGDGSSAQFWNEAGVGPTIAGANFQVRTNGNTTALHINSSQNVGIGTTAPGAKLTVVGNGEFTDTLVVSKGASDTIQQGSSLYLVGGSGASYTQLQQGVGRFIIFGFNGSGWVERFTINNTSGNVGIGTTGPGYKLDVSGTIRATGDVIAYSDARVKENVETLDGALDKVMKMRGVSYNKIGEQEKKVGVIAQEILEVLPEVVSQDETGTYSVAYGNISAVLIEAIKELTNTVKEQQKQIDELKSKLK